MVRFWLICCAVPYSPDVVSGSSIPGKSEKSSTSPASPCVLEVDAVDEVLATKRSALDSRADVLRTEWWESSLLYGVPGLFCFLIGVAGGVSSSLSLTASETLFACRAFSVRFVFFAAVFVLTFPFPFPFRFLEIGVGVTEPSLSSSLGPGVARVSCVFSAVSCVASKVKRLCVRIPIISSFSVRPLLGCRVGVFSFRLVGVHSCSPPWSSCASPGPSSVAFSGSTGVGSGAGAGTSGVGGCSSTAVWVSVADA